VPKDAAVPATVIVLFQGMSVGIGCISVWHLTVTPTEAISSVWLRGVGDHSSAVGRHVRQGPGSCPEEAAKL